MSQFNWLRRIRLDHIWLILPLLAVYLQVNTGSHHHLDLWHHLNSGREMMRSGELFTTDPFAHTLAGQTIFNQNWLADILFYELMMRGGRELLTMLVALFYTGAMAVLVRMMWRVTHHRKWAAAAAGIAVLMSVENLGLRPQVFSMFFFIQNLWLLVERSKRWWGVAAIGVVQMLWANMHGAFMLGIVLAGAFWAGAILQQVGVLWELRAARAKARGSLLKLLITDTRIRHYGLMTLVAVIGSTITPHTGKLIDYVGHVSGSSQARQVEEWLPPDLSSLTGFSFYAGLLIGALVIRRLWQQRHLTEILLLLGFGYLGCGSIRMVMWYGIVLAWSAAQCLAQRPAVAAKTESSTLNLILATLLGGLVIFSTPWTKPYNVLLPAAKRATRPADEPSQLAAYLQNHSITGQAFNTVEWGAYITWVTGGQVKVFIDGRLDFFPDAVFEDYTRIGRAAENWKQRLEKYRVDVIILPRAELRELQQKLAADPDWQLLYEDGLARLYRRIVR
ncbi:MAG: hypothetical protein HJJLKODD_01696 [Phycisphaerae bacterium]|nr:hypothetical protein [Phycisphaerae bacterium]